MLAGKRSVRVGDQLLREIADILTRKVRDPRVEGVTLTGIEMTRDLRNAKIYFSAIGDNTVIKRAQSGLDSAKGFIKREVGMRMDLRYMPEIVFKHDPTLETAHYMEDLLRTLKTDGEKADD